MSTFKYPLEKLFSCFWKKVHIRALPEGHSRGPQGEPAGIKSGSIVLPA